MQAAPVSPHSSSRQMGWQQLIDVRLGLFRDEEPTNPVDRARLALINVRDVPDCVVCETLYAEYLCEEFSIGQECLSELTFNEIPVSETIYAIGRSYLLGIKADHSRYVNFCLTETCVALHDVSLERAADGILSLASIKKSKSGIISTEGARFLSQSVLSLQMLLELFEDKKAQNVLEAAQLLLGRDLE